MYALDEGSCPNSSGAVLNTLEFHPFVCSSYGLTYGFTLKRQSIFGNIDNDRNKQEHKANHKI